METNYKITIPEPCTENWDKMTPNESGRFCMNCSKTVVDFTAMLPDEVQHFFIQNKDKKVCGRFKKSQLDTIIIQIPNSVLQTQTHYHKMFLLALFVAMGTTLFSCSDKNGNKQKIDKVEVVEDTSVVEHITVGEAAPAKGNLHRVPPPPPPKVDHVKFVKPIVLSNSKKHINKKHVSFATNTSNCVESITDRGNKEEVVYNGGVAIETDPEYDGGIEKFYAFFKNEFKLPEEARGKTGEIQVSLVIKRDGSLEDIKPVKDLGFGTTEEVIRVLKASKKWKPGEQNGKKISVLNLLTITIQNDTLHFKMSKNYSPIRL